MWNIIRLAEKLPKLSMFEHWTRGACGHLGFDLSQSSEVKSGITFENKPYGMH